MRASRRSTTTSTGTTPRSFVRERPLKLLTSRRGDSSPCTMNSDHVPVVVKLLVDDVLVLGFEEELEPASRVKPEAVLRCRIRPLRAQKNGPKAVLRSALL